MTAFARIDGELWVEGVALAAIAARFGTPCYVYSRAALEQRVVASSTPPSRAFRTSSATR